MLIGEYTHTLDDKKRLTLPKKFKSELGKKIVVTRGLDNCLFVYSAKQWQKISSELQDMSFANSDSRGFNRFFLSGAVEVDLDKAGRMLVPDYLKDFANLKKTVVLAGVANRIEIWDEKSWGAYKTRIEKEAEVMAEKINSVTF